MKPQTSLPKDLRLPGYPRDPPQALRAGHKWAGSYTLRELRGKPLLQ